MTPITPENESVLQRRALLSDYLETQSLQQVVRSFSDLYKVGIKVFDERGARLADVKVGSGDFCGYVFSALEGRRRCTATVGRVKDGSLTHSADARPAVLAPEMTPPPYSLFAVPCFSGLRYLAAPLTWDGEVMGRVVFGPFIPAELEGLPESLTRIEGLVAAKAEELLGQVRRAPEGAMSRIVQQFMEVLHALINSGQRTFLASQLHVEATLESNRELEAHARRLEEMNARLKELDRLKSSFLATVSHELRTPLTSIIGYSEMLREGMAGPLTTDQRTYVGTIMDKGESLLRLISSLLDLSQIEAGKLRLSFEQIDLLSLVAESVSTIAPQAQKKGVRLSTVLPEIRMPRVVADRERLKQILVNLLANSLKFTSTGGWVLVRVSPVEPQPLLGEEQGYALIVEDSGMGIPPEQLDRIFESFYQVDHSSTRSYGGAGLGLAIVKSFVEGHGGRVQVESEPGRGSTFRVVCPEMPAAALAPDLASVILPVAESAADGF